MFTLDTAVKLMRREELLDRYWDKTLPLSIYRKLIGDILQKLTPTTFTAWFLPLAMFVHIKTLMQKEGDQIVIAKFLVT